MMATTTRHANTPSSTPSIMASLLLLLPLLPLLVPAIQTAGVTFRHHVPGTELLQADWDMQGTERSRCCFGKAMSITSSFSLFLLQHAGA